MRVASCANVAFVPTETDEEISVITVDNDSIVEEVGLQTYVLIIIIVCSVLLIVLIVFLIWKFKCKKQSKQPSKAEQSVKEQQFVTEQSLKKEPEMIINTDDVDLEMKIDSNKDKFDKDELPMSKN